MSENCKYFNSKRHHVQENVTFSNSIAEKLVDLPDMPNIYETFCPKLRKKSRFSQRFLSYFGYIDKVVKRFQIDFEHRRSITELLLLCKIRTVKNLHLFTYSKLRLY